MQKTKLQAPLSVWLFCAVMLLCAVRPVLLPSHKSATHQVKVAEANWAFHRWNVNRAPLSRLPLTQLEQRFAKGFPGYIGRFSDGNHVWVIRHVSTPTRMLHSAVDCYKGLGYKVSTPHIIKQADDKHWRCFEADKQGTAKKQVCERIFDATHGEWTDVSAWYWQTQFSQMQTNKSANEWWAVTRVSAL